MIQKMFNTLFKGIFWLPTGFLFKLYLHWVFSKVTLAGRNNLESTREELHKLPLYISIFFATISYEFYSDHNYLLNQKYSVLQTANFYKYISDR